MDIRVLAKSKGVPLWRVARTIGISEPQLYRWLRDELAPERRKTIVDTIESLSKKQEGNRQRVEAFRAWERRACITWAAYCRMLESWRHEYAPKTPEEELHPRFIESLQKLDYANYVYETIFICGHRDFELQAKFYQSHREEVKRIAEYTRQSGYS
jgi:hypothetical protein